MYSVIVNIIENSKLKMSNYLIIGASSGIGKKTAEFLKKSGHQVYGTYNKTQNTNED